MIFATEQTEITDKIGAILISFIPSEAEYSKIKLAIDGFKDKFEIINLFSERDVLLKICRQRISYGKRDLLKFFAIR